MDNIKIFYSKILADKGLENKLDAILGETAPQNLSDEQIQQIVELAKEVGVEITGDDIKNYLKSRMLSDEQLEQVAGGFTKDGARMLCFVSDSKISTPSGGKKISDIAVGDEVYSLDAANKKIVSKVVEVRPVADEEIIRVEFSNGAIWNTTASQWFYCGSDDYACVLDDKGKSALTESGATAKVVNAVKTGKISKVYDFIVDGVNVFFVDGVAAEGYSVD